VGAETANSSSEKVAGVTLPRTKAKFTETQVIQDKGEAVPSFMITVNKATEIRVNLPTLSSIGVHLNWVGGTNETEDGFVVFHIGGSEREERVRWDTPELSVGDEITIRISEEPVVDSVTSRVPLEKIDRNKSCE
jgi:hypothetical protein